MAEAKKSTKATSTKPKTKTVPAKKPATKPAGKSVKPKATKTATKAAPAKTASKPATKPTSAKPVTKPASTTTPSANKKAKKLPWIIASIIAALLLIGLGVFFIVRAVNSDSSKEQLTLENGKGENIDAKYIQLDGYNYKLLAPTDGFSAMSASQIAEDYGTSSAPNLVWTNKDNTVNIALSKPENELSNNQIDEYLEAMKAILELSTEVLGTDTFEANGRKVGTIRLVSSFTDEKIYNQMAFFSYNGELAIISFNCLDSMRGEWEKVGENIIKSLVINQ